MLTPAMKEILLHALGLDQEDATDITRDYYICPDGNPDIEALVANGMLVNCGVREWLCGDTTYRVTTRGREEGLALWHAQRPKLTRGQSRYVAYLRSESGLSFIEWLKLLPFRNPPQ